MPAQPDTFERANAGEWSDWVLEHGLPQLLSALAATESVPIARWVGPRFGAVMHLRWWWDQEGQEPRGVENDIHLFVRRVDGWEPSLGGGGSGWFDPPLLRPTIAPAAVFVLSETGSGGPGWYACAFGGVAGAEAEVVEVLGPGAAGWSMPIESPIGAFVAAIDGARPSLIRVRNGQGELLEEVEFAGYEWASTTE